MEKVGSDLYSSFILKTVKEKSLLADSSEDFKSIFEVFTETKTKNKYWKENLMSLLGFIEKNTNTELVIKVNTVLKHNEYLSDAGQEVKIKKPGYLLPKDKVKKGINEHKSVQLDNIKEAQILIGPNPYLQNSSNKGIAYVDVNFPQPSHESFKTLNKLKFINKDKNIEYAFEPQFDNESQVVELHNQQIKLTYVKNKFLIQSMPGSVKVYICLLNSRIVSKQIFQVRKTVIKAIINNRKLTIRYSKSDGNTAKENVEREIVFYLIDENLNTEALDGSKKYLRIYKVENRWIIETLTSERNVFRLLHNKDTKNKRESYPLLLSDGMLFNVNGEFLKLQIGNE